MKKYCRHIAYLTLCLFLLNSGLSLAAGYGLTGQSSDDGQRVLICTSTGVKWVSLEDFSGAKNGPLTIQKTLHDCPLCCIGNAVIDTTLVSSALFLSFDPSIKLVYQHVSTDNYFTPSYYYQQAHPRAPPTA